MIGHRKYLPLATVPYSIGDDGSGSIEVEASAVAFDKRNLTPKTVCVNGATKTMSYLYKNRCFFADAEFIFLSHGSIRETGETQKPLSGATHPLLEPNISRLEFSGATFVRPRMHLVENAISQP
jgi:hypothetical protein